MDGSIAVKTFSRNSIEFQREIGSGSFGKVWKGQFRESKKQVAVKIFYQEFIGILPNVDSNLRATAYDELAKVAVLDHENVVRLLGMVEDDIPWLIFEYMRDGNLLEYVMRKRDVKERTLIRFCRDICNGMDFLHRNHFLHKDLAARNILLAGKVAKIADLGLCSFLTEEHNGSYALGGKLFPYRHAATECIVECIFTFESDVWSFGVLLFEIFTGGAVPYGSVNKQPEVRRFIADGKNPTHFLIPNCSKAVSSVMEQIFNRRRADRPAFSELLLYFDNLLGGGGGMSIPRPKREPSPSPSFHPPQEAAQGSSEPESGFHSSSPNLGVCFLESPQRSSSNSDLSHSHPQYPIYENFHSPSSSLQVQESSQGGGRRRSESFRGRVLNPAGDEKHDSSFLKVGGTSASPRRTASFTAPPPKEGREETEQRSYSEYKEFVPNRFVSRKQ